MTKIKELFGLGFLVSATAGLLLLCLSITSCESVKTGEKLTKLELIKDTEFGGAFIGTTNAQLKSAGYDFGDSVNITFSDGHVLKDIPYYSGYNTKTGELLLCGYPGYEHPHFTMTNMGGIWELFSLSEDMYVSITMNEKAKYLGVEEALSLVYSNNIYDFDSAETFANFRPMNVGLLKENKIYRSASPCDNKYLRSECSQKLAKKAGVQFILDLADTETKLKKHLSNPATDTSYVEMLDKKGMVATLGLNCNFHSDAYADSLGEGLRQMIKSDGPYLVHCTEGKDRTGFVCFLLEALCDATYEEMKADYMVTYKNYYNVTEETDKAKFDTLVQMKFDEFVTYLTVADTIDEALQSDLGNAARIYLMHCGLSVPEINTLIAKLTN